MSVPGAGDEEGASPRPFGTLGPTILRVAGWPIETVAPLRSQELAARIDEWIDEDDAILQDSEDLSRRLHALIPAIDDRETRRSALALKRCLHGTTRPLPKRMVSLLSSDRRVRNVIGPSIETAGDRRDRHAVERDAIEHAYATELARARHELDRIVGDDRFLRALCVASPSTFRRWQRAQSEPVDERSRRRLQSTAYRYLMRAVGRATPNALWAGIALEDPGGSPHPLTVARTDPITRVGPTLGVFARALETMCRSRPWLDSMIWRLNPTLRRASPEAWELGTFEHGRWCVRQLSHHPAVETMTTTVALSERLTLRDVESRLLGGDPGLCREDAMRLAEALIDTGLLWSTTAIPPVYANAWQALDSIIQTVPPQERPFWQACRETLGRIAETIESRIESIDPAELRRLLDDARIACNALLDRYGAAVQDADDVLVIDRTAPFRFRISTALASALEDAVRVYWRFDRFGLGTIETQVGFGHVFGLEPGGSGVRLHDYLRRGADDFTGGNGRSWEERVLSRAAAAHAGKAREAFARWEREIELSFARRVHRLDAGELSGSDAVLPPGSALLMIGVDGAVVQVRMGGVTPDPCFFYSRFHDLLGADRRAPDCFLAWQTTATEAIERQWPRLKFVDLAIRNHRNPNVTARPRLTSQLVDPLDDGDGSLLRNATIACDPDGRPTLVIAGEDRLLIPAARSAAVLAGLDRFASILASASAFLGRPALLAPMPRFDRETKAWRHLPRLVLAGATISPERWTPAPDIGASLASARGAERFILWRRFVRAEKLPVFVHAFWGPDQTESLLACDAALGVDLLGQELNAHGPALMVQEMYPTPDQFVVRDEQGRHYTAELAVAWQGDAEFWKSYVSSPSSDETDRRSASAIRSRSGNSRSTST